MLRRGGRGRTGISQVSYKSTINTTKMHSFKRITFPIMFRNVHHDTYLNNPYVILFAGQQLGWIQDSWGGGGSPNKQAVQTNKQTPPPPGSATRLYGAYPFKVWMLAWTVKFVCASCVERYMLIKVLYFTGLNLMSTETIFYIFIFKARMSSIP